MKQIPSMKPRCLTDDDGTIDDTTPNETEESDSNDNEMNTPGSSGEGGCQGSAMGFWPMLLALLVHRRPK